MKKILTLMSIFGFAFVAFATPLDTWKMNMGLTTSAGNFIIGTTTSSASMSVVTQSPGNGTIATTTLQIGNISTTTSRSSIQINNSAGAPTCLYVVGTTLTIFAGTCK